jgi:hypothetical protein
MRCEGSATRCGSWSDTSARPSPAHRRPTGTTPARTSAARRRRLVGRWRCHFRDHKSARRSNSGPVPRWRRKRSNPRASTSPNGELVPGQDRLPSVSALRSSLSINADTTGPHSTVRPTLVLLAACSSSADASAYLCRPSVSRRGLVVLMVGPSGGWRRVGALEGQVGVVRAGARAYLGPRSGRAAGR